MLVQSVKEQGYEGLVAKRRNSVYEPGLRTGAWMKMRVNANLPEAKSGRWGQGLTKAKMAECQWLKPVLVGQFEFLEWTGDNHLRHSKFVGLREGKKASDVVRE